ncbi:hypothetical protein [Flavihumibacter sp. CACIAM 22H1]|uniref:hypothetical protein n=1 Tax=Flavihumibacter sp. CACIAM 22H1 TaxID=1812911 RepID=UPI0007A8FCAC|nr:hypothetical protein [Flavihumibacter sp. CACIAM 22H1]KYP13824.1 MAG: hypothetical protein A1D16_11450 [Flavihumibacter sp. CACIAM 22H1]
MFTIDRNSSCVAISIQNKIPNSKIIEGIREVLSLSLGEVVLSDQQDNHANILPKLYIDYNIKPKGIPIYCMICSVLIHEIIPDWEVFLIRLANNLSSEIFIDVGEEGFLITPSGVVRKIEYCFFFVNDIECLKIL